MKKDLRDAIRALMKHRATQGPTPDAPTIEIREGPQTCVVPLLAFARQSPTLPDDFRVDIATLVVAAPQQTMGVTLSKWLQAHIRGDGAIYLGTFDVPHERGGALVVYGSPMMTEHEARKASLAYRKLVALVSAESTQAPSLGSSAVPALPQDGVLPS